MKSNYEWIKKVFERIPELIVTLDNDPNVLGPIYLREKLTQCRTFLNEINKYYQIVKEDMWELVRARDVTQTNYNIDLDKLLAENEGVKKQPSHKDRVALANQMLKPLIDEINKAEAEIRDLSALEEVLKLKLKDLRDANSDIRVAKQLMIAEIDFGAFYGKETPDKKRKSVNAELGDPSKLLEGVKNAPPTELLKEAPKLEKEDLSDLFSNLE
jgi:hypothetical protein